MGASSLETEDDSPQRIAKLLTRHDWNSRNPRQTTALKFPVTKVVSTWADVNPCYTTEECKQRCRDIQKRDMENGLPDIQHNFLVGGDGNIYEGRGWHHQGPTYSPELKYADELTGKSVEIAFLERYSTRPSAVLMRAGSDCVAYGLVGRFLQEKVLFYWKTPTTIEFLSSYETNAPGTSNTRNFTDPDNISDKDRDQLNLVKEAMEKNASNHGNFYS